MISIQFNPAGQPFICDHILIIFSSINQSIRFLKSDNRSGQHKIPERFVFLQFSIKVTY